jgi:hypothetical protein
MSQHPPEDRGSARACGSDLLSDNTAPSTSATGGFGEVPPAERDQAATPRGAKRVG